MEDQEKDKGGRPTKYKAVFNTQARKLCMLGSTDAELADFFEVNVDTIHEWKKVYPKFSDAIKKGKEIADAEVAEKLYKRATGYSHADVDIKVIDGDIVKTDLVKHYPPDTAAAIFWLKNRKKAHWRDKVEHGMTNNEGEDVIFLIPTNGRNTEKNTTPTGLPDQSTEQ